MRTLYHVWLSASSRAVRVGLAEKGLEFTLQLEKVWERREHFLTLNPTGEVPVLVEPDGEIIAGFGSICEYLEDVYKSRTLIGSAPLERAEVRRLTNWFAYKFDREITQYLYDEKFLKRFLKVGGPDSEAVRAGIRNLHTHLDYIGYLADRRRWLAGDELTLADIMAAAHLSVIDYIGDVPWDKHPNAKDWYARVKSRPSFRPVLADQVPGYPPASHYANLDF